MKRVADDVWVFDSTNLPRQNDPNAGGKAAALEALKLLAPESVTAALATALKSKNESVRSWAAAELQNQKGDETAVEPLIQALSDTDGWTRKAAAESLGKLGGKSAAPALMRRVADDVWVFNSTNLPHQNDPNAGGKAAALEALKLLAPEKVTAALATALKSKNESVRSWAAAELGQLRSKGEK